MKGHLSKPETQSRVCITVENSPNFPECLDEAMETGKKVLYCFYNNKIFLKDNSTNEGKCWFFKVLIETDFFDTRSYFLPANQNLCDVTAVFPYSHKHGS